MKLSIAPATFIQYLLLHHCSIVIVCTVSVVVLLHCVIV